MALVSYLSTGDVSEKFKPVFEGMERKAGAVPNVYRALAHSPELLDAFMAMSKALGQSALDGKLRELAYIKASELNGCDYCLHYHRGFGLKAGLTDRQVNETARFEESDAYDDLQRDVLRYAHYQRLSTEQIAADSGISEEAVKATLHDALRTLWPRLRELGLQGAL